MKKYGRTIREYFIITFAVILMDIGIYVFKFPNNFSFGGISGLAVVITPFLPFTASQINLFFNGILLVIGFLFLGKDFGVMTAYVTVVSSLLLNVMEAHVALLELENVRIMKEMRNCVNRKVNCETANINKTVSAAVRQAEDIMLIRDSTGFEGLPDNLRQIAQLRLARPEATLKELGEALDPPVGKSGVNHRLRKLSNMAEKLRDGRPATEA